MSEEKYSSLIPQRSDSQEIIRAKHAQAAGRLVEPAPFTPQIFEANSYVGGNVFEIITEESLYFRKAFIWGANAIAQPNSLPVQLRFNGNENRTVNPGEMIVIEALPGQKLDVKDMWMSAAYPGETLTFELY